MAKAGNRRSFLTYFSCKRSTLNAHCHFLLYSRCEIFFILWYSFSLLHPHLLHCHFFSHLKHESCTQFCHPLTTISIKTGNLEHCRQQMEIMLSNVLMYIYIYIFFTLSLAEQGHKSSVLHVLISKHRGCISRVPSVRCQGV